MVNRDDVPCAPRRAGRTCPSRCVSRRDNWTCPPMP
jgi:hypothetical protein